MRSRSEAGNACRKKSDDRNFRGNFLPSVPLLAEDWPHSFDVRQPFCSTCRVLPPTLLSALARLVIEHFA